ncbi:MAG: DUF393 domain-containing protein [Leptospiraceae bacterium]|nr:DUF393 domain-containing protein [Leptospiraceae bacterium]
MNDVFFYNGNCDFCNRMGKKLKSLNRNTDIEIMDFQKLDPDTLHKIHPDLTPEILASDLQFVYRGVRYPGFFAVRKISGHLNYFRWFSFLLYLPLVPILGMFLLMILKKKTSQSIK